MATKIVNIDALASAQKAIVLDGATHEMRELTVQEFIDRAAEARRLQGEEGKELPVEEQIAKTVEMIADAFPTIPRERLGKLVLPQLMAIVELIVTPPEQIANQVERELANQGNGRKA